MGVITRVNAVAGLVATSVFALDASLAFGQHQLEEIVVTARKREESLQDVPVAVQAFDSRALEAYATAEFEDLNSQVSGLIIYSSGPVFPSINLRGIQGDAVNAATDESVAVNLDGVAHSSPQLLRFGLFDLQSIEVLKGPQALFFGKNSPGGILAMKTKDPTDEFFSEVQFGYEMENERAFGHVILSGPLTDTWGGRLAVRHQDAEGYYNNIWGRGDPTASQPRDDTGPNFDETVYVGTLQGDFERSSVTVKAYHAERDQGHYAMVGIKQCNELTPVLNPFSDCKVSDNFSAEDFIIDPLVAPSIYAESEPTMNIELTQLALDFDYEISDSWELNAITGWVDIENNLFGNVGARPANIAGGLAIGSLVKVETLSQELRLSGDFDSFRLMFGAFVDDRELETGGQVWISPTFRLIPDNISTVDGQSWSVFAQTDISLSETLELSLGARYTEEERSYSGQNFEEHRGIPAGPHRVATSDLDYDDLSPEVALSWRPQEELMLYATYKEGFKSGGFNVAPLDLAPTTVPGTEPFENAFEEENVEGFEVGAKWQLLDNTLRINTAIFSYEYSDLQQNAIFTSEDGGIETRTINAGKAIVEGFEADILWQTPLEPLRVSFNVAYNDSQFDDFVSQCNEYQIFVDPSGCNVDVDDSLETDAGGLLAGTGFDAQDREGHPLRRAPEWAGSLGINFDSPLTASMRIKANLLASYSGSYQGDGENNPWAKQDSYTLYNGGIGIYAANGAWSLDFIGRNLTDEAVALDSFDLSRSEGNDGTVPQATAYARNPTREWMLQLTLRPDVMF